MHAHLRYFKGSLWGAVALATTLLSGCADSPTGMGGAVALKVNLALETPALASQIEVVTLTLRYGTSPALPPDTLNFSDGVINDTVSIVPGDTVTFIVRALNGAGLVLYEAREGPRQVQAGTTLQLSLLLRPAVLMLRAGPLFQETELPGPGLIDINIDVYNVDSLFGASFRVHYDTTVLNFVSVTEGNFLKGIGVPIPTLALLLKDSADFVAYSLTRLRQTSFQLPGASTGTTPGRLATLRFSKRSTGTSNITFEPTAQLVDPQGRLVRTHASLVLESATVRITPN